MRRAFRLTRLRQFAAAAFPCHKSAKPVEDEDGFAEYHATEDSIHCAGALIFNEKRETPHQMMRICERIGLYDMTKLNMEAKIR